YVFVDGELQARPSNGAPAQSAQPVVAPGLTLTPTLPTAEPTSRLGIEPGELRAISGQATTDPPSWLQRLQLVQSDLVRGVVDTASGLAAVSGGAESGALVEALGRLAGEVARRVGMTQLAVVSGEVESVSLRWETWSIVVPAGSVWDEKAA